MGEDATLFKSADIVAGRPAKRLRLPRLAQNGESDPLAVLNWQAKKASDIWTKAEWTSLCEYLHNENPPHHFIMAFRDDAGIKQYKRSKRWTAERAISWAWASIAGEPRSRLAFVPYAHNDRQQSRWGGMDFDAHAGESGRARELAFAAFRCFLNMPELCVILETSGSGGWHVWAISPDFHGTREWIRLLKSVASLIGTVIADGICEIFPPDSLPSRFGKGMRAPGCWNPATDTVSEIVWENSRSSLASVLSGKSKTVPLNCNGLQGHFPDTKKETSFSSPSSPYRLTELIRKFGIKELSTRNRKLSMLTGEIFYQVGYATARLIVEAQFHRKTVSTKASEQEHLASFDELWRGLAQRWQGKLSKSEREKFQQLETENERDAFRIIRSFSRKAKMDGAADFPIVRNNLAERLGITGNGAAGIRDKLARLGVIKKTADYVPNKFAARFKWL